MHEAARAAAGAKGTIVRLRDSVRERFATFVGEAATSACGPDEKRRARILAFLNAALFVAGLAFIIVDGYEWLVHDEPHAAYNTLTSVAFCAGLALSWEFSRRGRVTLAAIVHVSLMSVGLIAFFRYTPPGTMNIVFVESVIVASFVLRPWAGFVLAGVSMASFATLTTMHNGDQALDLQMFGGLLGVAIISWVGASYLEWTASALHTTTDDLERDRLTLRQAEEERQQVELALHATEQQTRTLFEKSPAGIVLFDNDMTITDCNEKLASQTSSSREKLIGTDGGTITRGKWREAMTEALRGRVGSFEGPGPPPAPAETWYRLTASPLVGQNGEVVGGVGVVTDLTDRKQAEELVERFAFYDPLTSLPNRKLFLDRLLQAVEKLARSGQQVSVAVIDLDHFKDVNDLIGHAAADRLLEEIVARVSPLIRRGDTFARMGSDEFALLIPNSSQLSSVVAMADRLLDAFREPWEANGEQVRVTASIGLATYPDDTENAQSLLKSADTAMRRAKDLGRDGCQFFDQTMNIKVAKRLRLERELRTALEEGQLAVYYQPQIDLGSGRIVVAEALVRWQHPERGLVAPLEFVPLAEEAGLIGSIDTYVMATACREAAAWRGDCGEATRVAVNISPRHLHSPRLPDADRRVDRRQRAPCGGSGGRAHGDRHPRRRKPRDQRADPAPGTRSDRRARRLRDGVLLTKPPAQAAHQHGEDRPLLRLACGDGRTCRGDRESRDRPGAQFGPAGGRRRHRDRRTAQAAEATGLRRGAGLSLREAAAGGGVPLAACCGTRVLDDDRTALARPSSRCTAEETESALGSHAAPHVPCHAVGVGSRGRNESPAHPPRGDGSSCRRHGTAHQCAGRR